VFILNYDEGGQFFDHAWTPVPPIGPNGGVSSVPTTGEVNNNVMTTVPAPIGLGFRVPLLVVSPFTRGNLVSSQVLDHTSVVQLLEKRFDFTSLCNRSQISLAISIR
jgi:phospholipase C